MKDVMNAFNKYIKSLAETTIQEKTEHTDRGHLKTLLTELASIGKFNTQAINEQSRQGKNKDGFGAPDFTVNHTENHTVVGYIENKKIGENLDKVLKSKQIEKYQKLSENLILTDYLEWIWIYKDSKPVKVRLCDTDDLYDKKFRSSEERANEIYNLIASFYDKEPDKIASAKVLAEKLARPSIELKKYITEQIDFQLKKENEGLRDELYAVYEIFKTGLFEELGTKDFADSFAQMLTYTIFLAKLNTGETLSIRNAKDHIPQAFSLIKTLVRFLDLLNEDKHVEIKWAIENILSVLNNIDAFSIAENLSSKHGDGEKDAYIYFYEDFLREYDEEIRVSRGVYYTPPAVVQFIVNQVSSILEEDFNLSSGIANNKVKLLDFACGTGTFLFESYKNVLKDTQKDSFEQNELIEHLLKNFFGFEIMISSYIISHLKLSQFLKEQGFDISKKDNKRIGVYLTNTLENKQDIQTNLFAKAVAQEGKKAKEIKDDNDIIAIIGNPPYNCSSQNEFHDANPLLSFHDKYKCKDERNSKSIEDDYIKFIAFAHRKINESGRGVVGVIVNNSFLKGLTHRKMRNELMKDFDKIYIIDLHGNARIGEVDLDGGIDQNVFDIMQGVCIILLVKNKDIKNKGIFHIDLYGKRKEKFKRLYELERKQLTKLEVLDFNKAFRSTKWGADRFIDDLSFFSPMREATAMLEYGKFWGLKDIFEQYTSGIKTANDAKLIAFCATEFEKKIDTFDANFIEDIAYRPFDKRKIYYDKKLVERARFAVMQHMLKGGNVAIVSARLNNTQAADHIFITDKLSELKTSASTTGSYHFPLYLHNNTVGVEDKTPNFKPEFARFIAKKFAATPEEVLAFIYASLHSPAYRTKYLELLKIDFPRINFDVSLEEFKRLSSIGQELIDAHLMRRIPQTKIGSCISTIGFEKIVVEKPKYVEAERRIYIRKEVYFDCVSAEIWNFKIGGYQVLDKYLKERFERILSNEEIKNITNIIRVLAFTVEKIGEVDKRK